MGQCRGLAGTILVYKLAAALAEQGADLDKVEAVAKYATTRLGTLGIGLDHCHVCPQLYRVSRYLLTDCIGSRYTIWRVSSR